MVSKILISKDLENRRKEINQLLALHLPGVSTNHPDVLYFSMEEKLGIDAAKKIKHHFSLKPYSAKGRVAILEDASNLTLDAQNALLKTLEELPEESLIILGADSDSYFLPTILSRCQILTMQPPRLQGNKDNDFSEEIEKLLKLNLEEKFEYIEKLKDKEEFLDNLILFFRQKLLKNPSDEKTQNFLKETLQAKQWSKQNVNIRAILEYLMLVIP